MFLQRILPVRVFQMLSQQVLIYMYRRTPWLLAGFVLFAQFLVIYIVFYTVICVWSFFGVWP